MRYLMLIAACAVSVSAFAGDRPDRRLDSRRAIQSCEADAGNFEGDQRKLYIEKCLSKRESRSARNSRCRAEASGMRSDERRRYVEACLKGEALRRGG
jgi:hypothetical protein